MKAAIGSGLATALAVILVIFAVLPGCDDVATGPPPFDPELSVWLGSYSSTGDDDSGAFMIDIYRIGREARAELVIRSHENDTPYNHLYMKGRASGDRVELRLDTDWIDYGFTFDVELTIGSGGTMTGTFYFSTYDMTGDIACVELEQAEAAVDTSIDVNAVALGTAFDGDHVWISTSGRDHFLMDSTTAVVDTVAVFLVGEFRWTSDALTSGGSLMYGGYAVTVAGPEGSRNESDIVEFERDGDVIRRFRTGHRTSGLAWSGTDLWSLPIESDSLYRVDLDGAVLEAVPAGVPDLVDIEFDGEYFWAIGWFMRRMYKIDSFGETVAVYHIPGEQGYVFPTALTFDGSHFWYSFNTSYLDSRMYRLSVE